MPIWWYKDTNQYTVQCTGCGKSRGCVGNNQITTMHKAAKAVNILPDGKGHTYCEECLEKGIDKGKFNKKHT